MSLKVQKKIWIDEKNSQIRIKLKFFTAQIFENKTTNKNQISELVFLESVPYHIGLSPSFNAKIFIEKPSNFCTNFYLSVMEYF